MLKDWPSAEKPREKLMSKGANTLSDAELLAIFLRTGVQGCNVVELAKNLLTSFGSIANIYKASPTDFCKMHGLGMAKYVQLQACLEMTKRFLAEELSQGKKLTSSHQTKNYLISELRNEQKEVFLIVYLNTQHQVIDIEKLFNGTINATAVYPRVVLEQSLKHQASAVIFAHNHPSGCLQASQADKDITQQLTQALALVDINVLDHLIIAGNQCISFAEQGLL